MQPPRWIILTVALGLIGPLAAFAASPLTDPATKPTTQSAVDVNDDTIKQINWPTISTAVKLAMKNQMLVMSTDLQPTDDQVRLKIADFAGKTVVVYKPDGVLLTIRHEFSVPPSTTVIYSMSAILNNVNLSVDSEDTKELRSIQFIQNVNRDNPDTSEPAVKLYVSVSDMESNKKSVDLKLSADTVVQLRRKYPRETAVYFQPMLAALRQEEVVFSVEHRVAWQVLQSHFKTDELTADKLKRLVKDFDAEDYATRESASEALDQLGEPAALIASKMTRSGLTSEQNSRLETFLAPYKPLNETEAKKCATDEWFLLDCLYTDNRAIRDAALKQLAAVFKRPIDLKSDASPAAWRAGLRELRKQFIAITPSKPATTPAISKSN